MALMLYSDLEDGRTSVATLDTLDTALKRWVRDALADSRDRSSRPLAQFAPSDSDRCGGTEELALHMIQRIRHAQVQLLDANAYLRYLCPDCPRDGRSACRAGRRRNEAATASPGASVVPGAASSALWPAPHPPRPSKVVERLRAMAAAFENVPADDEDQQRHRRRISDDLHRMANSWRRRGLADSIVNVHEKDSRWFYLGVMGALSRAGLLEAERTDVRHSPVNFIAKILLMLAEQSRHRLEPAAREALMAALVARNAAIEGDTATVDEFTRSWLGLGEPESWRAAVEMALLGNWTSGLESRLSNDAELVDLLRRHAKAEHRHLQPLWKRKVGGRLWRSLDEPAGDGTTLRDIVTDHRRPEDSVFYGELEDIPRPRRPEIPEAR
ncbi:hypothetical protein [Kitasatospora sp. NPDC085879]|uniref:hypothetical protein n=1 Tax=Kitasatospora sp. NPDC085879 TaxID=3154769 RepID=UPI003434FF7A